MVRYSAVQALKVGTSPIYSILHSNEAQDEYFLLFLTDIIISIIYKSLSQIRLAACKLYVKPRIVKNISPVLSLPQLRFGHHLS